MRQLLFEFPGNTAILEKVGNLAADAGRNAGFDDMEIGDIELAVDEICSNTIIHGLKRDPTRMFQLVIQWEKGFIEILVHEDGEPFNPAAVQPPDLTASVEERTIGGLGIFFVHKVMDEVEYHTDKDGIKTFRMSKRAKSNS